jgi:alpha-1,6-mannosyltransferase
MLDQLKEKSPEVKWLQYCADPMELAQYYRAADLFVHPGIKETFGLVSLESQACGTPVIGIRGSRMDRVICHDQESWASENTPEALAAAIEEFSGKDLEAIGQSAARAVAERFAWPRVFDHIFSIYREMIERRQPRILREGSIPNIGVN